MVGRRLWTALLLPGNHPQSTIRLRINNFLISSPFSFLSFPPCLYYFFGKLLKNLAFHRSVYISNKLYQKGQIVKLGKREYLFVFIFRDFQATDVCKAWILYCGCLIWESLTLSFSLSPVYTARIVKRPYQGSQQRAKNFLVKLTAKFITKHRRSPVIKNLGSHRFR